MKQRLRAWFMAWWLQQLLPVSSLWQQPMNRVVNTEFHDSQTRKLARRQERHDLMTQETLMVDLGRVDDMMEPTVSDRNANRPVETMTRRRQAKKTEEPEQLCRILMECQMCSNQDREDIPECQHTGKFVVYRCVSDGESPSAASSNIYYESCQRTMVEEEFLMVRFQVLLLLMGLIAVASVRKQRMAHATLFDQRKLSKSQRQTTTKFRKSCATGLELTHLGDEHEMVPLTTTSLQPQPPMQRNIVI
jgi:Jumping translocation breakpoint protein (JTB)